MTVASPPSTPPARRLRRAGMALLGVAGVLATVALTPATGASAAPAAAAATGTPQTASMDALPTVQINGVAWAQVVVGTTVYVAGSFTSARPAGSPAGTNEVPRENLLAYDIRTGELVQSFHHVLNAEATSIAASPDGTRLYVAGKFTTVDGVGRYRLMAIDVATGNVITTFKPIPNSSVAAVTATADAVYFGGSFTNVNGVARARVAAVNTAGALLTWAPTVDNYGVNALLVTPDRTGVVIGGRFNSVNGQPAFGSAAVDATTGATRPWALNQTIKGSNTAGTLSLTTDGTLVYGGNYTFGNGNFEGTWAADPSTGAIVWANDCLGDTYSAVPLNGVLYASSHAHNCSAMGGFPEVNPRVGRFALAYDTAASSRYNVRDAYGNNFSAFHTSAMLNWFPVLAQGTYTGASQAGWSVAGTSDYVLFGGEFPSVNGVKQQGLVRFAAHPVSPNTFGPTAPGTPTATAYATANGGSTVVVSAVGAYDPDDASLRYDLYRSGVTTPVASTTSPTSGFWTTQASVTLTDANVPAGTSPTYQLVASDPWGRQATSDAVTPQQATGPAPGTYGISNVNSRLALATSRAGTAAGTLAVQDTVNPVPSQTWQLRATTGGHYLIANGASGLVLGISNASRSNGATALIWTDTGAADHLWDAVPSNGHWLLRNVNSGLVLGVQNMSRSAGASVLQWSDNGTADHLWDLTPISP